ncbi:MAG: proline--tRNA ligase [Candidatus Diapherotrites archaeon]|uniref:Proline--tRNA ligase n=1 Tax=Candidatus Iainarchaeum sp. TaxID=3101447 RepID=A0A8T3YPZ7_9ARCH|nr:proline--tRNA ligase [Candidatus Diapherotrites archaeon]
MVVADAGGKGRKQGSVAKAVSGQGENTLGITVKKSDDFVEWYNQVVLKAGLADYAPIRGFMVMRPNGYAIWERIQRHFDKVIEGHGVENAYFPLLIPKSFFEKEAEHAQGFEPELAWVESRQGEGAGEAEERLAIRPTSETIMYDSYAKWVRSWRDLPLRINQWCNVLRWEVKQTKLFLRTREFLWQEGHCVYATKEECDREVRMILDDYRDLVQDLLAIPVVAGQKTKSETFAGALYTTTIEALMPDGRALQMGTSHNLGQGFASAFGIRFTDEQKKEQLPWQSSWGFSTRLIGAIVMVHGDDKGLVLPPRVAKRKIVVVPIVFEDSREKVLKKAREIGKALSEHGAFVDDRDNYNPGWKYNEWELKGVPLRIEVGPKDVEKGHVVVVRRDTGAKEFVKDKDIAGRIPQLLEEMHKAMFAKAKKFLDDSTAEAKSEEEFSKLVAQRKMVLAQFCCLPECEQKLKEKTGITSRCIPFNVKGAGSKCIFCGEKAESKALFAKAY